MTTEQTLQNPYGESVEFNSNLATLIRIDNMLKQCEAAAFANDHDAYFKILRNLRKEAIVKMKHNAGTRNPCNEQCMRCNCEKQFKQLQSNHVMMHQNKSVASAHNFIMQLDNFEIFLRDFMDKKGMLLKDGKTAMENFRGI